ncbi:hypothetical protein EV421DRAFT_2001003 [Armillaria borealis]|uniref:AB hydrolase-1 domain-containing protein n=1 Tax=Armillaria borealis TaxID=47425 RepID=A0AA39MG63_9AGAR|nr:hypothetical protein EV421DRAFT_2001003 [Armillaria borealis]
MAPSKPHLDDIQADYMRYRLLPRPFRRNMLRCLLPLYRCSPPDSQETYKSGRSRVYYSRPEYAWVYRMNDQAVIHFLSFKYSSSRPPRNLLVFLTPSHSLDLPDEVALFIDTFVQKFNLLSISSGGGVALLGWSLGATFAPIVISSVDTLPEDVRRRLSEYMRSLILYEPPPPPIALGLPTPKQNWTFLVDTTVPENLRLPAFGQWCTSYFDHADIVGRDLDKLSWVLASPNRIPTFFNGMPVAIQRYGEDAATDLPFLFFSKQILAAYRKAFFDPGVFPSMKRSFDDEKVLRTADARAVKYRIIPGANHFVHWDDPEKALDVFIAMA